jgi:hypothetical protein
MELEKDGIQKKRISSEERKKLIFRTRCHKVVSWVTFLLVTISFFFCVYKRLELTASFWFFFLGSLALINFTFLAWAYRCPRCRQYIFKTPKAFMKLPLIGKIELSVDQPAPGLLDDQPLSCESCGILF